MATEIGKAFVQIVPSAKGISGAIQKELDPEADAAGKSAGSKLGMGLKAAAIAAIAAAGAALGKVISSSIAEGANLQQSLGGIETLFKGSADKVKQYANDAYKTAGLSANAYMENVTSFSASLLQSMGGNTEKAADVANMAMIDMSDNANKMGTSMELIQNAYQGFAKQNYTMLDNLKLGYGGTKTEMERLLADATKLTGVKYDISNLSDVYEAIHAVQEELGITGTTALESAETFSGSFASMKAAMSNVLGGLSLGQDITPALQGLATTVSTFLFGNLLPMVGNVLMGLPGAIITFITAAAPLFMTAGGQMLTQISNVLITGLPGFITSFSTVFLGLLTWITANMPSLLNAGVEMLTNLANGIMQSIPLLITTAGDMLNGFIEFVVANLPMILQAGVALLLNFVDGIIANLPAVVDSSMQAIGKFLETVSRNLPQYIAKGAEVLMSFVGGILQRLPAMLSAAEQIISTILSGITSALGKIVSAGAQIVVNFVTGILSSIGNVISAIANIGSTIISGIGNINLWNAGKAIIDGFLNGLKASFNAVKDFVSGIADWIKAHKGPIEYDRKLLIPAGDAIMNGLNEGLQDQFKTVKATVGTMAGDIAKGFNTGIADNIKADAFSGVGIDTHLGGLEQSLSYKIGSGSSTNSNDKLERAIIILTKKIDELKKQEDFDLVLDDGTIVGKLAPKIDTELQKIAERKER